MASPTAHGLPAWSWFFPLAALCLLGLQAAGLIHGAQGPVLALAVLLLGGAVFSAVHHADILAIRVGEPVGSILLTVAVTVIEVGLIVSIQLSDAPHGGEVARDTVFSAVMIVLDFMVGLGLVLGASRHHEQHFQLRGAVAALSVLGALTVLALVLPNYTRARPGPYYSPAQLLYVAAVTLALYATFVFVQTVRHRPHFLDAGEAANHHQEVTPPTLRAAIGSAVLLPAALVAVIFLAEELSHPLEQGIAAANLPRSVVGIAIAMLVLLPEGLASVRAALRNRLQTGLNLALGSAIASIGLTIPTVAVASLIDGRPLALGLSEENTVLLVLTLFISTLTLGTGRTTVLQGAVHLVIFAVFLLLAVVP